MGAESGSPDDLVARIGREKQRYRAEGQRLVAG